MRRYTIDAPAKINLTLHVLGKREDGFHEIVSLMAPISLADHLVVEVGGSEVQVEVPGAPGLAGDENLCARAVRAFVRHSGIETGARIVLDKRVPVAAGLGGGSSDAGAVLRCLAQAHELPLDHPDLLAAAAEVGSDVPFFLRGAPAIVRGRGELLEPGPVLPTLWLLVVQPPFGISAGDAYRQLADLRASGRLPRGEERSIPPPGTDPEGWVFHVQNDLQPAVESAWPVGSIRERLLAAGAPNALLAGSGSCVVGLFPTPTDRDKCSKSFEPGPGERLFAAQTLPGAPPLCET